MRSFEAVSLEEDVANAERERLDVSYAEFLSFVGECIRERDKVLEKLGATPNGLPGK
ncbi:MAG: hypothetical protein IPM54_29555 [Polyangiaceae bacterium]|nr:hypothetical protein [Polyangiaceae bacterium]